MEFQVESIWGFMSLYGLKIIVALAIFFIGKWVAKRLVKMAEKMMSRSKVDDTLVQFAGNILYALALAFVIIASLAQLGVQTTSLVAVMAAAGLAVGLALQGSLSNLAAGVMIIMFRPFGNGDYIEAGGTAGTVEEISIFTTLMKTPSNEQVIVPNSQITDGVITNYSRKSERRIDLVIGVGYDDDLVKVKKILTKIVESDKRVLKDPAPVIAVHELADSSVNFVVRPWVKTSDYWTTRWDLTEAIKVTFDKEGISIPYPQQDTHIFHKDAANDTKKSTKKAA